MVMVLYRFGDITDSDLPICDVATGGKLAQLAVENQYRNLSISRSGHV